MDQFQNLKRKRKFYCFAKTSQKSSNGFRKRIETLSLRDLVRCVAYIPSHFLQSTYLFLSFSTQVYWDVDAQEQDFLKLFGGFFEAIKQHPPLASLTDGLTRNDTDVAASEGITDIYRGEYKGNQVSITVFRAYSTENLEGAKGVRF